MKAGRVLITVLASVIVLFVGVTLAQERGTRDEAKAMVDAAVQHVKKVGPEQAFKDFTTDKSAWTKKDLFVVAYDLSGKCLLRSANDKQVGRNMIDMADPNGMMVVAAMTLMAQTRGEGWVDYVWPRPDTNKNADRSAYVRRLPNYDGLVAVAIYR